MFARDILVKGSSGTSSLKDSEAHVTKTRFGSCSVSNYMDTKDSGNREGLTRGPCHRYRTDRRVHDQGLSGSLFSCANGPRAAVPTRQQGVCGPLSLSTCFKKAQ